MKLFPNGIIVSGIIPIHGLELRVRIPSPPLSSSNHPELPNLKQNRIKGSLEHHSPSQKPNAGCSHGSYPLKTTLE